VAEQFHTRAATLKTRGVVLELQQLLRTRPREGLDEVHAGIERVSTRAHTLRELALLATARSIGLPLPEADAADAERIAGVAGTDVRARLGMQDDSEPDALRTAVTVKIDHWRRLSQSPLADRATVRVCRVVLRSLEEIASEVGAGRSLGPAPDIMLSGAPGDGLGHDAAEQGEEHQRGLRRKKGRKRFAALAQRNPLR